MLGHWYHQFIEDLEPWLVDYGFKKVRKDYFTLKNTHGITYIKFQSNGGGTYFRLFFGVSYKDFENFMKKVFWKEIKTFPSLQIEVSGKENLFYKSTPFPSFYGCEPGEIADKTKKNIQYIVTTNILSIRHDVASLIELRNYYLKYNIFHWPTPHYSTSESFASSIVLSLTYFLDNKNFENVVCKLSDQFDESNCHFSHKWEYIYRFVEKLKTFNTVKNPWE